MMKITESFTKDKIKGNQKIIIYGAGRYGELAFRGIQSLGLDIFCFADRMLADKNYLGYKVISPEKLTDYKDDIILIASLNYFNDMLQFVMQLGAKHYYDISELLALDYDTSVLSEYALDEKNNIYKYKNAIEEHNDDKIVIQHCELVLTEKCTLKCKDCSNLMQYYKSPEDMDFEHNIIAFNRFLNTVDSLIELRLLGGEPFIYKNIDKVIKEFADNPKIKHITVYTNSTVVPSDNVIESLKINNLTVHMSDYGAVSRKLDDLKELFSSNNIDFCIHKYKDWYDLGGLDFRGYDDNTVKNVYNSCISSKCFTFHRGRFYLCPRAAHGECLQAFKNNDDECIDYNYEFDVNEYREKIKRLISDKDSITACHYCNGLNNFSKTVKAAIQMKG